MNPRAFTTKGEMCHRLWLSKLLALTPTFNGGIDLYDDELGIELKCRYTKWNHSFAVDARQISLFKEENPQKELFWAFLFYDLTLSPQKIRPKNIGKYVSEREVWFLPWDWIKQFPVSEPKTGPYVYVHRKNFPLINYFNHLDSKFESGDNNDSSNGITDYHLYFPRESTKLEERLDLI